MSVHVHVHVSLGPTPSPIFRRGSEANVHVYYEDCPHHPHYPHTLTQGEVSFDAVGTREGIDPRILKYELLSSSEAARATVAIVDMEAVLAAAAAGQLSNTSFIYLGESNDSTVWPGQCHYYN